MLLPAGCLGKSRARSRPLRLSCTIALLYVVRVLVDSVDNYLVSTSGCGQHEVRRRATVVFPNPTARLLVCCPQSPCCESCARVYKVEAFRGYQKVSRVSRPAQRNSSLRTYYIAVPSHVRWKVPDTRYEATNIAELHHSGTNEPVIFPASLSAVIIPIVYVVCDGHSPPQTMASPSTRRTQSTSWQKSISLLHRWRRRGSLWRSCSTLKAS